MNPANAVEFDNVSIVFGQKPEKALSLMDAGQDRAEIERLGTQADVAARLGLHRVTIARREAGTLPVTAEAALAIRALKSKRQQGRC